MSAEREKASSTSSNVQRTKTIQQMEFSNDTLILYAPSRAGLSLCLIFGKLDIIFNLLYDGGFQCEFIQTFVNGRLEGIISKSKGRIHFLKCHLQRDWFRIFLLNFLFQCCVLSYFEFSRSFFSVSKQLADFVDSSMHQKNSSKSKFF